MVHVSMLRQKISQLISQVLIGTLTSSMTLSSFVRADTIGTPTSKPLFTDEENGLYVYRDSVSKSEFWYLPKFKFVTENGKNKISVRTRLDGSKKYTIPMTPYFDKGDKKNLSDRFPEIKTENQLHAVVARKIGIDIPEFNVKMETDEVTDQKYLGKLRYVSFVLTDQEDIEDFEERIENLGQPIQIKFSYQSEKVKNHLSIKVSCKDMYDELSRGLVASASGSVKGVNLVGGVDLQKAVRKIVNNRNIEIVSKGQVPEMQSIIRNVVASCFDAYDAKTGHRINNNDLFGNSGSIFGGNDDFGDIFGPSGPSNPQPTPEIPSVDDIIDPDKENEKEKEKPVEEPKKETPKKSKQKKVGVVTTTKSSMYGASDASMAALKANIFNVLTGRNMDKFIQSTALEVNFKFKKDAQQRDDIGFIKSVEMEDMTSVVSIPVNFGLNPESSQAKNAVKVYKEETQKITDVNSKDKPKKTVMITRNEEWVINAAFVPMMKPFNAFVSSSKPQRMVWLDNYESAEGDLYYRIGTGDWSPVNGRVFLGTESLQEGTLQFYIDKASIYKKLPEKLRKSSLFMGPAIPYDLFAPTFEVTLNGKQIIVR